MTRLTYWDAHAICSVFGIDPNLDFYAMPSGMVDAVIKAADSRKYKEPKNTSGSRARMFHAYLMRALSKGEPERDKLVRELQERRAARGDADPLSRLRRVIAEKGGDPIEGKLK